LIIIIFFYSCNYCELITLFIYLLHEYLLFFIKKKKTQLIKKKKNKYHISELNIFFNELEDLDHTLFNEKKIIKKKKL